MMMQQNTECLNLKDLQKETAMPYMRKGRTILHKKNGKWTVKQVCETVENAKRALRFLNGLDHGMKPKKR